MSPPPITITFFPRAFRYVPSASCVSRSDFVVDDRNSIAKCTPSASRPGIFRSRGHVAPVAKTTASFCARRAVASMSLPTSVLVTNLTPSSAIRRTRRSTTCLSSFMLGMPYMSRPPTRSARSYTVTEWPARLSWSADASPAGPEPITATVLPVRC